MKSLTNPVMEQTVSAWLSEKKFEKAANPHFVGRDFAICGL